MNSKVLIGFGLIAIILAFAGPTGKNVKKGAGTALTMTDLETVEATGMTVTTYSANAIMDIVGKSGGNKGRYYLNMDFYQDGSSIATDDEMHVNLHSDTSGTVHMDIRTGDYITLTYDGGLTKEVYFPSYNEELTIVGVKFYIASDGSTYYDEALTQDACTTANGCMGGPCECSSGECCDGCNYEPSGTPCTGGTCDAVGNCIVDTGITFNQFITYGNRWVQGLSNTC